MHASGREMSKFPRLAYYRAKKIGIVVWRGSRNCLLHRYPAPGQ